MNGELEKYFAGTLSATEKTEFLNKLRDNPEAKKEFARMKAVWAVSGLMAQEGDPQKTVRGIAEFDKRLKRRSVYRFRIGFFKYAAMIVLLISTTWFIANWYTQKEQKKQYTEINVPKGQRVNMTLPDGTSVWLSPQSKIKIPNEFNRKNRMVELNGEGYFEVTKNAKKPFIVKTQLFNIQVLGTRFNVFAYAGKESKFETCLVEGRVLVYNKNNKNEKVYLNPHEKVSLVNNRMVVSTSNFDNEEYLKSGIFSFRSKPFGEILSYLALWYNVQFNFTGDVKLDERISGKIRQSEDVDNILIALQGVYPFKFKKTDDEHYEIY